MIHTHPTVIPPKIIHIHTHYGANAVAQIGQLFLLSQPCVTKHFQTHTLRRPPPNTHTLSKPLIVTHFSRVGVCYMFPQMKRKVNSSEEPHVKWIQASVDSVVCVCNNMCTNFFKACVFMVQPQKASTRFSFSCTPTLYFKTLGRLSHKKQNINVLQKVKS